MVHENDIDEDQEIVLEMDEIVNEGNVEEGAYITDMESIRKNENPPQDDSFGVLVNYFDDVNNRMD